MRRAVDAWLHEMGRATRDPVLWVVAVASVVAIALIMAPFIRHP